MAETRQFRMHPQLLFDVIQRQAGTLAKAILEGVMNSVDAGAKECRITVDEEKVELLDDGKGFRYRQEIEEWFEVFGQPHDETENKTYGTFRMGRGQMFAFGVNTWRTGKFKMMVDVKGKGLDYELLTTKESSPGCKIAIRLYKKLLPGDVMGLERQLGEWCRWCQIPVYLNGENLSKDPAKHKWDHVTDDAYVELKPHGSVSVYNLGVHVLDLPGYRFGTGGTVVCRKQVRVNFARNDIQDDCPVWQRVKKLVNQKASDALLTRQASLNDADRQRLADKLLAGELRPSEACNLKLITAATGRHYECKIMNAVYDFQEWKKFSSAKEGDRRADRLMKQKIAFVVADRTLERFHVRTAYELHQKLVKFMGWKQAPAKKFADFEKLSKSISEDYEIVDESEWTTQERLWITLLRQCIYTLHSDPPEARGRRVLLGASEVALGWTDGSSYICIERRQLHYPVTVERLGVIGNTLLHELCHGEASATSHDHDQAFYEKYHDCSDSVGRFIADALKALPGVSRQLGKRLAKVNARALNQVARAKHVVEEAGLPLAAKSKERRNT